MIIVTCPNCGGTHIPFGECPFIKSPCVVCGDETIFACSDCGINSGGKESVHVCGKSACRDQHEEIAHSGEEDHP